MAKILTQLSVHLENRPGALAELTETLTEAGVNILAIYAITFGIGAAMAGAAGSMLATTQTISPVMGNTFVGKSFIIATLGGLGTVQGALIGGLVLGLVESIGAAIIGPSYQLAIGYAILVLVLIFRPEGIAGRQFFAEVK